MRWGGVGALVMGGGWEGWGVRGGEGAGLARLKRRVFLDSELQTRAGAVWPEGVELCRAWNCSVPFFLCVVYHMCRSIGVCLGCVWLGLSHSGHTAPRSDRQRLTLTLSSDRIMVSYTTSVRCSLVEARSALW